MKNFTLITVVLLSFSLLSSTNISSSTQLKLRDIAPKYTVKSEIKMLHDSLEYEINEYIKLQEIIKNSKK